MRLVHEESKIIHECHVCPNSVTFSRRDNLTLHLKRIHGLPLRDTNPIQNLFSCDLCLATFLTKVSIVKHMASTHLTDEREIFNCNECEKVFCTQKGLTSHTHGVHEMRFCCRYCKKPLISLKTLKTHERKMKCRDL